MADSQINSSENFVKLPGENPVTYLELSQRFMIEFFCENS